jgi:hypothetical protein
MFNPAVACHLTLLELCFGFGPFSVRQPLPALDPISPTSVMGNRVNIALCHFRLSSLPEINKKQLRLATILRRWSDGIVRYRLLSDLEVYAAFKR